MRSHLSLDLCMPTPPELARRHSVQTPARVKLTMLDYFPRLLINSPHARQFDELLIHMPPTPAISTRKYLTCLEPLQLGRRVPYKSARRSIRECTIAKLASLGLSILISGESFEEEWLYPCGLEGRTDWPNCSRLRFSTRHRYNLNQRCKLGMCDSCGCSNEESQETEEVE